MAIQKFCNNFKASTSIQIRSALTRTLGKIKNTNHKQLAFIVLLVLFLFITHILFSLTDAFIDEYDNMLGGLRIAQGDVLYRDYFSHHMPLTYFVVAPLALVFGNSVLILRLSFAIILFIWKLIALKSIYRTYGIKIWSLSLILLTIIPLAINPHYKMMLAETITAYALMHAVVIFISKSNRDILPKSEESKISFRTVITFSILGCIPAMSAVLFAPISLFIYLILIYLFLSQIKTKPILLLKGLLVILVPYALLLLYLLITNSLKQFIFDAFTFNSKYYSIYETSSTSLHAILTSLFNNFKSVTTVATSFTLVALFIVFMISCFILSIKYTTLIQASLLIFGYISMSLRQSPMQDSRHGEIIQTYLLLLLIWSICKIKDKYYSKITEYFTRFFVIIWTFVSVFTAFPIAIGVYKNISSKHSDNDKIVVFNKEIAFLSDRLDGGINVINSVTDKNDKYIASYRSLSDTVFFDQIKINAKPATSIQFIFPWQMRSAEVMDIYYNDIIKNNPKVILDIYDVSFSNMWNGGKPIEVEKTQQLEYNEQRKNFYLANGYFHFENDKLKHYFFRNEDRSEIEKNAIIMSLLDE